MGNRNYSRFSQNFKRQDEIVDTTNTIVVDNTNDTVVDNVINEIVEETEETTLYAEDVPVLTTGFVSGCNRLNMRKEPNTNADVLTILEKDTDVAVILTESTDEFYKVSTASGIEGYCMKKFINVK